MSIPPFLDWGGNRFGITDESLHVYNNGGTVTATIADVATATNQTNGSSLTRIVDADGHQANVQSVTAQIAGDEYGVVTNAIVHGLDSQGNWHDVKTTPSGELTTSSTIAGIDAGVILPTTRADDFYNDAFQRLRVSNTDQRFDSEFLYDKQPLLFNEIVAGAGTATHNANSRDVTLAIGGTAITDAAGLYQRWFNPYTPGNSQFIAITGALNGVNTAGTAAAFLRTKVTGSVAEEVINQSAWVAGTTGIDWSDSQIFLMDFQSLKVGRIRFALDRGGEAVHVASIENDNERAGGYWQLANAPSFWRTYNTASNTVTEFGYGDVNNAIGFRFTSALNASQTCRAICTTVKSEGGGALFEIAGLPFRSPAGVAVKTVAATLIPLISIQVQPTFNSLPNRMFVVPTSYSIQTDNPIDVVFVLNGTLTNSSFAQVDANSSVFADSAATAISGGTQIEGDLFASGGARAAALGATLLGKFPLSVNYAGTTGDILSICAIRTTANSASATAVLKWREVR